MLDITISATTALHLGLRELIAVATVPFSGWWFWRTRHALRALATALCRQISLIGRQEASRRLAGQEPLMGPPKS